jgi:hypothetical protein
LSKEDNATRKHRDIIGLLLKTRINGLPDTGSQKPEATYSLDTRMTVVTSGMCS